MKDCNAIILAAGKGTRMLSELPKCAYPFYGKPMIVYIINMCKKIQIDDICVVVGHKKESIENLLQDKVKYAYQKNNWVQLMLSWPQKIFWKNIMKG